MSAQRGRFISVEGIDGAGKSTHVGWLAQRIAAMGHSVVATREPGGTVLGEKLRELLLHQPMTHDTEALLMFAARREHLDQVIRPALIRGDWVVCDRFSDATFAYQCGGHSVAIEAVEFLESWTHGDCQPDRTFLFDVPSAISRERLSRAQAHGRALDKFERESAQFFDGVRSAYLARANGEPTRFRIIDSSQPIDDVQRELEAYLAELDIDRERNCP